MLLDCRFLFHRECLQGLTSNYHNSNKRSNNLALTSIGQSSITGGKVGAMRNIWRQSNINVMNDTYRFTSTAYGKHEENYISFQGPLSKWYWEVSDTQLQLAGNDAECICTKEGRLGMHIYKYHTYEVCKNWQFLRATIVQIMQIIHIKMRKYHSKFLVLFTKVVT